MNTGRDLKGTHLSWGKEEKVGVITGINMYKYNIMKLKLWILSVWNTAMKPDLKETHQ